MLIDGVMSLITNQELRFDPDGSWAAKGKLIPEFLEELMNNTYLKEPPPKSTGREEFGLQLADKICRQAKDREYAPEDVVHTITRFTACSIAGAYRSFIPSHHRVSRVYVAGGGSLNPTLMDMLAEEIKPLDLHKIDELGFKAQAVEATGFAVLAYETVRGVPNNIPSATGARDRVVLGKIAPAKGWTNHRKAVKL
jgi:anhydro-N-acetylmuramic acid kinase